MAHFEQAYAITRKAEGGYANKPGDTGGETWRGVSRKNNPNWHGWQIIDTIKATHPQNLDSALGARADLEVLVKDLYQQDYWNCLSLDLLQCQQTANQLFDISVNCGTGEAKRMLIEALNVYHQPPLNLKDPVGPLTIGAVNQQPSQKIYDGISKIRTAFYESLAANRPSDKQFLNGWLSRIYPFVPDTNQNVA
jgi:lysozyme family protein